MCTKEKRLNSENNNPLSTVLYFPNQQPFSIEHPPRRSHLLNGNPSQQKIYMLLHVLSIYGGKIGLNLKMIRRSAKLTSMASSHCFPTEGHLK